MKKTAVKMRINVPALAAWELVSDLSAIESFLPGISDSRVIKKGSAMVRRVELMDGQRYEEQFDKIDNDEMELWYHMAEPSPFKYKQLRGRIKIFRFDERSCEICWSCSYQVPDEYVSEIDDLLSLIMTLGIKGIERRCRSMELA